MMDFHLGFVLYVTYGIFSTGMLHTSDITVATKCTFSVIKKSENIIDSAPETSTARGTVEWSLPDEQMLLRKLFPPTYDNSVRPVQNSSKNVEVKFGFTLIQIMNMDEKNQILVTNAWLEHVWEDERLMWDPERFNGLTVLRLPATKLWLPDIVLYNNADDYTNGYMLCNAMITSDGVISWSPPARMRSSCKVDITYFPFDRQTCKLKFGSWTYDKAQVDLLTKFELVDISNYIQSGEWKLLEYNIVRHEVVYPIGDEIYPDVTVVLVIERRILYYILNILFPCFWLNILSVLNFCLPPDAGEKITLSITVLLSYSVFMLLIAESMPPTSEYVPLIGIYLTVSMAMSSMSVILTVFVLKIHHCCPHQKPVPRWMRYLVLNILARLVRCTCSPKTNRRKEASQRRETRKARTVADEPDVLQKLMTDTMITSELQTNPTNQNPSNQTEGENINSEGDSRIKLASQMKSNGHFFIGNIHKLQSDQSNPSQRLPAHHMAEILKYLRYLVLRNDTEESLTEIADEWKEVAMVTDRCLFYLILCITLVSTLVLLVIIPLFKYSGTTGI